MIHESIIYIGISQSLFAALVLGTRRNVSASDRILIACLLAITIRYLTKILIQYSSDFSITDISAGIIPLTFGPFLYLYTKYLTRGGDRSLDNMDWLHSVPFAIFLLVSFVLFRGQISMDETAYFTKDRFLWIRIIFGLAFFASVLVYMIFTFIMLSDYRIDNSLKINQPNGEKKLVWLNYVSFLFSALFISYIVFGGINALTFNQRFDLDLITNIGLIALVYAISYFGIKQSFYLQHLNYISPKGAVKNEKEYNRRLGNTGLESEMNANRLKSCMDTDKPYLQPELSLAELAKILDISKSELTSLLNYHMGTNFFSFVNQYRLKTVLQKLEDPKQNHLTILSIAFDCGFNSKSTFNNFFKEHTGVTPTAYRRNQSIPDSNS
jgi:AraC-like DNA-binding protein